jgi:hypothetical protein
MPVDEDHHNAGAGPASEEELEPIFKCRHDESPKFQRLLREAGYHPVCLDDVDYAVVAYRRPPQPFVHIGVPPEEADAARELLAQWDAYRRPVVEGLAREVRVNVLLALLFALIVTLLLWVGGLPAAVLFYGLFGTWGIGFFILSQRRGGPREEE